MTGIETRRLRFKRPTIEDAEALFRTFGDPDVMKYWFGGPDRDPNETKQRILELDKHWKSHAFGDWGIVDKKDSGLMGFGGLHYIADMTEVNIGYAFEESRWRRGFGYEACRAILNYGFETLQLTRIVAVVWPDNTASISLIEKCGLEYWKRIIWNGGERIVFKADNSGAV